MQQSDQRKRLHRLISEQAIIRDREIKLSAGQSSPIYFDLRRITLHPEASSLVTALILSEMIDLDIRCACGPAVAAVPMLASICTASHRANYPVETAFVRPQAKAHGTEQQIEGYLSQTGRVLLLDDVATSGKSLSTCFALIEPHVAQFNEQYAYVVVDREQGAAEHLARYDIELRSLFKMSDFT